jgi:hypothetical protein
VRQRGFVRIHLIENEDARYDRHEAMLLRLEPVSAVRAKDGDPNRDESEREN